MGRYTNRINVKDPNALTDPIGRFLQENGFQLGQRNTETVWYRPGRMCMEHIIIFYEPSCVVVTAFIVVEDVLFGEMEMGIKGFVACVGKIPLKKKVRALEKLIAQYGAV